MSKEEMPFAVIIATAAQKMVMLLNQCCPANYVPGGASFAAEASIDSVLASMGISQPFIRRGEGYVESTSIKDELWSNNATFDNIINGLETHKTAILSAALYFILNDGRGGEFRENPTSTRRALQSILWWYINKTKGSVSDFMSDMSSAVEMGELFNIDGLEEGIKSGTAIGVEGNPDNEDDDEEE